MSFVQAYRMAIKSILGNKVRSFLTMLGVIIGVCAVIAAVAFAQGTTESITQQIESMGTNLVQISINGRNSNRNVAYSDLQSFAEQNTDTIEAIAPVVNGSVTVKYGSSTKTVSLVGTTPDYELIKSRHVQNGRFLLSIDVDYMQKVALIGSAIVKDVFGGANPLGKTIKINGQEYSVVGVLEEIASGGTGTDDDSVIIPSTVAQRLLKSGNVRSFMVQAASPKKVESAIEKLNTFLLGIYNNSNAFSVFNQSAALTTLNDITGTMMVILGGIAVVSLMVGGIGIMNIMLVSVSERTKEIGIRKAIGAKRKNILVQFLIEALMVTGIGGIVGIILGLTIIKFIVSRYVPPVYSPPWIAVSFGISLIVGVVFGMFPAYKASRMNPIEALRFE